MANELGLPPLSPRRSADLAGEGLKAAAKAAGKGD